MFKKILLIPKASQNYQNLKPIEIIIHDRNLHGASETVVAIEILKWGGQGDSIFGQKYRLSFFSKNSARFRSYACFNGDNAGGSFLS